jgi:hypothetical protein
VATVEVETRRGVLAVHLCSWSWAKQEKNKNKFLENVEGVM